MKHFLQYKLLPATLLFLTGGCFFFKPDLTPPELAQLGFRAVGDDPCTLLHPAGTLKLTSGKRTCFINGMQYFLPHAVQQDEDGRCRITSLGIEKVIRPLFTAQTAPFRIKTIIIDPGHGQKDFGARGRKHNEKDLNLALAKEVAETLKQHGFQVSMTRSDDTFLTLDERGNLANRQNGDLFLAIHHNASQNRNSNGVETYIATPAGSASSNDPETQVHKKSVAANAYDAFNIRLAASIQQNMARYTGRADRGVRFARFRVLALSQLPALLIEAGFVSNADEELSCADPANMRKIAEAITQAIKNYK